MILVPSVGFTQQTWHWPDGPVLYIMLPNGATPCTVDFEDFIAFAQAFNSTPDDPNFNINADTNSDGIVNFPDFIAFAQVFGKSAPDVEGCQRKKIVVSGEVMQEGKPFENVWIDIVGLEDAQVKASTKTDELGVFKHPGLARGDYALVAKQFGYTFSPDTLQIKVEDASVTVSTIQSVMAFGVVNVKVLRDSLPVSDVKVSFLQSVAGQKANGPWEGTTDPSGVTVIRVPVLSGQVDISGTYIVKIKNTETGETLDSWTSVPIQAGDTRRLVLDIGQEAYYIPDREYFFYHQGAQKVPVSVSEERLRVWFRNDADVNAKETLLNQLGLEDDGDHFFSLKNTKGRLAVLETVHHLKMSGLIDSVTPELDAGRGWIHNSNHLIVDFKDDATEVEIFQFLKGMGGTVIQVISESYEVEVLDLLSQDIFEVSERYRVHPLVRNIRPDFQAFAILWTTQPD